MRCILLLLLVATAGCTSSAQKKKVHIPVIVEGDILPTGWYYVSDTPTKFARQFNGDTAHYFIVPEPIVVAGNIERMELYVDREGNDGLAMYFDEDGSKEWLTATEKYVGKKLGFVINNRLVHTANVMGSVDGGVSAINNGKYSKDDLDLLRKEIREIVLLKK